MSKQAGQQASKQLSLKVGLKESFLFDNYCSSGNDALLKKLLNLSSDDSFIYLWGKSGTGKSHLLQALCNQFFSLGRNPIYIGLKEYESLDSTIFQGLEAYDLVCIDDLESILTLDDWELGLFDLFNRLKDSGRCLLISSSQNVMGLKVHLADLDSRLKSGLNYQLKELSDVDKQQVLSQRARARGFSLEAEALKFILARSSRSMTDLMELLDELDKASLSERRTITIPFLKEQFNW